MVVHWRECRLSGQPCDRACQRGAGALPWDTHSRTRTTERWNNNSRLGHRPTCRGGSQELVIVEGARCRTVRCR